MNRHTRQMRSMREHECPIEGCANWVPRSLLMCAPHWARVPKSLQRLVWAAWEDGAGAGTPELGRAQDAAIEAVQGRR